jgi:hypothetical protein
MHFESLTPREREIKTLVASALMSKQITGKFKLSEITVKMHRSRLMKRMADNGGRADQNGDSYEPHARGEVRLCRYQGIRSLTQQYRERERG